ncbi:MAG: murein L,D-transpeptidase catalytic domain family protein [Flavisolibacter sp.]
MKKTILLTVLIMFGSLVLFSFAQSENNSNTVSVVTSDSSNKSELSLTEALYQDLKLDSFGLSKETLELALKGYEKLVDQGAVSKDQFLTIVDFSQISRKKRFYVIDVKKRELVWNTFVSHGKNSGLDSAARFSNAFNSEASSLGFYVTKTTYTGKHGKSLRISGMEEGFNNNAEARGVVVHGAQYVSSARVNSAYMGRSQGCPALPQNEYAKVIDIIKDGSVMFIYSPAQEYIQDSPILNG